MLTKEEMEKVIQTQLTSTSFEDGTTLTREHFKLISSTQDLAKEKAPALENEDWLLFTADEQAKGRGTHNRRWASPPEVNIYGTFVFRLPNENAKLLFNIPQVTAYSVLLTLDQFGFNPRLKWVNDVLLNRKKVCGILCESGLASDTDHLSVLLGIGLNINMSEDICAGLDQPVTSLMIEGGKLFDKEEVLTVLQSQLKENIGKLIKHGFGHFSKAISGRMEFMGESIKVKDDTNNSITEGIMLGIDDEGMLLLDMQTNTDKPISVKRLMCGHIMRETEIKQAAEETSKVSNETTTPILTQYISTKKTESDKEKDTKLDQELASSDPDPVAIEKETKSMHIA